MSEKTGYPTAAVVTCSIMTIADTTLDGAVGSSADAAALRTLLAAVRLRDPALAEHGLRAAHLAGAIAEQLGCGADDTRHAYLGALLHDIGKLGVPEVILWKPAGLDADEWREMRCHPEAGHRLIVELVHDDVAAAVLHHHERIDAGGYPYGVNAGRLPLTVRIVQVADAFDAITSDRPYEPAAPVQTAIAELSRCAGDQFDPDVVTALSTVFGDGDLT
jgi:HD-GYP domain-containing protein (c-di-GMP phosphodiesterase class II)